MAKTINLKEMLDMYEFSDLVLELNHHRLDELPVSILKQFYFFIYGDEPTSNDAEFLKHCIRKRKEILCSKSE